MSLVGLASIGLQMPPHIQVPGGRESKYSTLAPDSLQLTGKHVTCPSPPECMEKAHTQTQRV